MTCARTTPYLTVVERRRIAHALRQLADAARSHVCFDPPPGMDAEEVTQRRMMILAEARDHDRLAGEIERNELRFAEPSEEDGP